MLSPAAPAVRRPLPRALAAALAAAFLLPAVAQAQFGGLVRRGVEGAVGKKVNDRVEQKVAESMPVELLPPRFDETWVEITPDRFDRYQRARAAVAAESPDKLRQADALRAQGHARDADARRLWESSAGERDAYRAADERWDGCATAPLDAQSRDDESAAGVARMQAEWMEAGMRGTVPAGMPQEFVPLMKQMAGASKRGDQAAVMRIQQRLMEAMQKASEARERAIATKKCGEPPAKPAAMVRQEALNREAEQLWMRADSLTASLKAGARAGLTERQEAMMLERMQAFLRRSSAPISRTFTKGEWDLLTARRQDVAALVGQK